MSFSLCFRVVAPLQQLAAAPEAPPVEVVPVLAPLLNDQQPLQAPAPAAPALEAQVLEAPGIEHAVTYLHLQLMEERIMKEFKRQEAAMLRELRESRETILALTGLVKSLHDTIPNHRPLVHSPSPHPAQIPPQPPQVIPSQSLGPIPTLQQILLPVIPPQSPSPPPVFQRIPLPKVSVPPPPSPPPVFQPKVSVPPPSQSPPPAPIPPPSQNPPPTYQPLPLSSSLGLGSQFLVPKYQTTNPNLSQFSLRPIPTPTQKPISNAPLTTKQGRLVLSGRATPPPSKAPEKRLPTKPPTPKVPEKRPARPTPTKKLIDIRDYRDTEARGASSDSSSYLNSSDDQYDYSDSMLDNRRESELTVDDSYSNSPDISDLFFD